MTQQTFGRYQIKKELGRGGMASVYVAYDPRFRREVALKVLPRHFLHDPSFRSRFEREAQTIAALEHNAIVPVYDFGEHEGQPYLVMRLMGGGTLADRLRDGPLPLDETEKVLRRIAAALDKAHANVIVHRDLKPGNVLFDDDGNAYLSDFGIVKVAQAQTLTATGGIVGTPAYMSPEQGMGEEDIDRRSDIYTLGVILFEMLTGRQPYRADTPLGVLMRHVNDPVPSVRRVRADLPAAFEAVVSKAMAKERANRYATAGELATDFAAAMRGEAVAAPAGAHSAATVVETPAPPPTQQGGATAAPPADTTSSRMERGVPLWVLAAGGLFILGCVVTFAVVFGLGLLNQNGQAEEATTPATVPVVVADDPTEGATTAPEATETPSPTETVAQAAPTDEPTTLPTETPSPTTEPTATVPPPPLVDRYTIGQSTDGRPLRLTQVGSGPHRIVLVGVIHGNEPATGALVREMANHFESRPFLVPAHAALYFIPVLNPDALAEDDRFTPEGVDLNRNWDTPSWVSDSPQPGGTREGSGGSSPFSEPETAALRDLLLELQNDPATESLRLILYHHHTGVADVGHVQPGYEVYGTPVSPSTELAVALSNAAGYQYVPTWVGPYQPTGEIINWSALQGFAAVDVELPPEGEPDERPAGQAQTILQTAIDSVLALMES